MASRARQLPRLAVLTIALALTLAACGDDGPEPVSDDDVAKITEAQTTITDYCIGQATGGTDSPGAGDLAAQVDLLIDQHKEHGDEKFSLGEAAGTQKITVEEFLRQAQTALAECAPDQAQKIDDALAAD